MVLVGGCLQHIYSVPVDEEESEEEVEQRRQGRSLEQALDTSLSRSGWNKGKARRRALSFAQVGAFFILLALWRSGRLQSLLSRLRNTHYFFPPSRLLPGKVSV